jgi:hypothetical protein
MPTTIGCIDGTHIRIQPPKDEEHAYVNRKGEHSINVQVNNNLLTGIFQIVSVVNG